MLKFLKDYILLILMLFGFIGFFVALSMQMNISRDIVPDEKPDPNTPVSVIIPSSSEELSQEQNNPVTSPVAVPPPIEGKIVENLNKPQTLRKEGLQIIKAGGAVIDIETEIAVTMFETSTGMMHRETVPQGTGMLFLFDENVERSFWMKDTKVSLDIIFIDLEGKVTKIHPMAEPQNLSGISSEGLAFAVLEIGGGEAQRLGVAVGDVIQNVSLAQSQAAFKQKPPESAEGEDIPPLE